METHITINPDYFEINSAAAQKKKKKKILDNIKVLNLVLISEL